MEGSYSAAVTGYDNKNNMDDDACTIVAAAAAADSSASGHRLGVGGNPGTSSSTDGVAAVVVEREHMFDKVVTPSDVGKLNRLVIPKQHAEKYFPLDSSVSDKGLLLNFEDGNGKSWRFRYSYWNSSQSYVITKGWSRFVKDKKLDAGDIVSFQRGVGDSAKHRLFIDWKRRSDLSPRPPLLPPLSFLPDQRYFSLHPAWNSNPLFLQPLVTGDHSRSQLLLHPNAPYYQPRYYYSSSNGVPYGGGYNPNPRLGSAIYFRSATGAAPGGGNNGGDERPNRRVIESVPVVQLEKAKAKAKAAGAKRRLRLFGVNMDCPVSSDEEEDECNIILSSTTAAHPTFKLAPHLSSSTHIPYSLPPI